ncbi:MAG: TetR family transcriptional regulator [Kiritimatiellae bacterium]|nr:TetR family transcriptional regulator [Kiritimatiellia bacterium]
MARRTQKDAEATRERILASALDLFLEKGYARTTFDDVAKPLAMTKGAVFWHFDSKEALLLALVGRAITSICDMMREALPEDRAALTFQDVAASMVNIAVHICENVEMRKFFLLVRTQVRWQEGSMAAVREEILSDKTFGPKQAFMIALENDRRNGRIRADVDAQQVMHIALAIWDGLLAEKIDGFLEADLATTISNAYKAAWETIRFKEQT